VKFVFQPLIELAGSSLLGFEALTRFPDQADPSSQFEEARREGRLTGLELRAIKGILEASTSLPSGVLVTLNASGPTIEEFARSGLKLDQRLVWGLELNELSEPEVSDAARRLADLMGCLLLIDDAGVAHATQDRILRLRPDIVKLDRTMIGDYAQSAKIRKLVDTLLAAATEVGAKTLAEGVETAEHLDLVNALGFDYAQGYYFSPARLGDEVTEMLQDLRDRLEIDVSGS